MAESTLGMTYDDIRAEVGTARGYGLSPEDYDADQKTIIDRILRMGCAKVYVEAKFQWSWLRPLHNLTIKTSTSGLILPADFGNLVGKIYFTDGNVCGRTLPVTNDGKVLDKRAIDSTSTGRPIIAAIVPAGDQRQELIFWPTSDDEYKMVCRYTIIPDAMGPSNKHHHGGAACSRLFVTACLAASEEHDQEPGPYCERWYPQALDAAKEYDRKLKPDTLSWNGESSCEFSSNRVTYSGTVY